MHITLHTYIHTFTFSSYRQNIFQHAGMMHSDTTIRHSIITQQHHVAGCTTLPHLSCLLTFSTRTATGFPSSELPWHTSTRLPFCVIKCDSSCGSGWDSLLVENNTSECLLNRHCSFVIRRLNTAAGAKTLRRDNTRTVSHFSSWLGWSGCWKGVAKADVERRAAKTTRSREFSIAGEARMLLPLGCLTRLNNSRRRIFAGYISWLAYFS